jgi:DNA-binding SARP family transcriptional activator
MLVLNRGIAVPMDQLADELWEGRPPSGARKLISGYAARLRALLGDPCGRMLVTRAPGYMLAVPAGEVDASHFEHLLATGREALDGGAAERAAKLLTEALSLWRGRALADIAPGPMVAAEAARLEELRLDALELETEADLRRGHHAGCVPRLRRLTADHPLRERYWCQLLRALEACARPAEALAAYAQAREVLAEELGTGPGLELQRLHHRLAAAQAAAHPGIAPPPAQLPLVTADFTGRAGEAAYLCRLLGSPAAISVAVPVAVISGPPGVGKTALAHYTAHMLRPSFPGGQLYAELAGSSRHPRDPGSVLGELLRALDVSSSAVPASTAGRAALLRSRTAEQKVLLVADDAASAEQVRPLVPGAAGCAVIVTSRSRLGALEGARFVPLGPLPAADALVMLSRIAGDQRVADEPEAAERLVRACGGLPLAVRIAGTKLATRPSRPVARAAATVADERRRLDELVIGDLSVRASVRSGYDALDERARRAFRRLGLLGAADFDEQAVAALLAERDASDVVSLLVDRSMLEVAETGDALAEPRYRMHGLLRVYATERLADEQPGAAEAALRRSLAAGPAPRAPRECDRGTP